MVATTVIGSHVALVGVLLAMSIPQISRIAEQLGTGYVPIGYELFVALVGVTFGFATIIVLALVAWSRRSRQWLIIADALTSVAAWSVFIVYVFANDLPILAMALAPMCLILAVGASRRERRNRAATG